MSRSQSTQRRKKHHSIPFWHENKILLRIGYHTMKIRRFRQLKHESKRRNQAFQKQIIKSDESKEAPPARRGACTAWDEKSAHRDGHVSRWKGSDPRSSSSSTQEKNDYSSLSLSPCRRRLKKPNPSLRSRPLSLSLDDNRWNPKGRNPRPSSIASLFSRGRREDATRGFFCFFLGPPANSKNTCIQSWGTIKVGSTYWVIKTADRFIVIVDWRNFRPWTYN